MAENMPIEGAREPSKLGRPPLRQAETLRPDTRIDSVKEAEDYAAKIQAELGDTAYQADEFYIHPDEIPEGWAYEWKSISIVGKENTYHMLGLQRAGWRPVDASRHPGRMPAGYTGPIQIKGLQLMEWPKVLSDKAMRRHVIDSKEVLRNSEAQLYDTPANTAPRDDPALSQRGINKVKREYVGAAKE